ncbi:MAG: MerR family transcriptional regulator, partial [Actinomycetota bacterium]
MSTHTIGEVLNRLKDEFEDITISKIRFLEAEGLISPDRTESGYRKFTDADIDRLRYVLRAQRDRYLPLKVIRDELDRLDAGLPVTAPSDDPDGPATPVAVPVSRDAPSLTEPEDDHVSLAAEELAERSGLDPDDLAALRDHGLLGKPPHDADDLRIAGLAAELLQTGLEARHLRMYKQFADREISVAEALVAPLLRQRNPDSRAAAAERAQSLAAAGGALHRA